MSAKNELHDMRSLYLFEECDECIREKSSDAALGFYGKSHKFKGSVKAFEFKEKTNDFFYFRVSCLECGKCRFVELRDSGSGKFPTANQILEVVLDQHREIFESAQRFEHFLNSSQGDLLLLRVVRPREIHEGERLYG